MQSLFRYVQNAFRPVQYLFVVLHMMCKLHDDDDDDDDDDVIKLATS